MRHTGHQRREAAALPRIRCRQRERAHRASMKRAIKSDQMLPPRVIPGQLNSALNGFGAGVSVIEFVRPAHGSNRRKAFRQVVQLLVVEIGPRHVDQFGGLFLNRRDDRGMTVAGGNHRYAGRKIEEAIAVHVFNDRTSAALGHQRIRPRVARRYVARIVGDDALCVRPRQRQRYVRNVGNTIGVSSIRHRSFRPLFASNVEPDALCQRQ